MYLYSEGIYDYHQEKGVTIQINTLTNEEVVTDDASKQQLSDSAELNKFNRGG